MLPYLDIQLIGLIKIRQTKISLPPTIFTTPFVFFKFSPTQMHTKRYTQLTETYKPKHTWIYNWHQLICSHSSYLPALNCFGKNFYAPFDRQDCVRDFWLESQTMVPAGNKIKVSSINYFTKIMRQYRV